MQMESAQVLLDMTGMILAGGRSQRKAAEHCDEELSRAHERSDGGNAL